MHRSINQKPPRPIVRRAPLILLVPAVFSGALAEPASAQPDQRLEFRISLPAQEASPGVIRRHIAAAARALCERGGVAAIYRNGAARCRQRVIAEAERQLQQRLAARPAAHARPRHAAR